MVATKCVGTNKNMKKAILVVASLSLIIPGVALAHGGTMMDFESADDNFDMMRYVED